jgi:hypothetical protein
LNAKALYAACSQTKSAIPLKAPKDGITHAVLGRLFLVNLLQAESTSDRDQARGDASALEVDHIKVETGLPDLNALSTQAIFPSTTTTVVLA